MRYFMISYHYQSNATNTFGFLQLAAACSVLPNKATCKELLLQQKPDATDIVITGLYEFENEQECKNWFDDTNK